MYLTYEDYEALGGTIPETDYPAYEAEAALLLDHWTLNRLKDESTMPLLEAQGLEGSVKVAMAALVNRIDGIRASRRSRADGQLLTSFDNGVNRFTFSDPASSGMGAEAEAYAAICKLLPVDLISACVSYGGAR